MRKPLSIITASFKIGAIAKQGDTVQIEFMNPDINDESIIFKDVLN